MRVDQRPPRATRPLDRPGELIFDKFSVTVVSGPDRGLHRASNAAEFAIGKDRGNDLVLTDPTVSRHHCTITAAEQGYRLRDLGSTNGTSIGGVAVESAFVKPGTFLQLGGTAVRFDRVGGKVVEPLSAQDSFGRSIGRSPAIRRIFALLPKVAASASTVLIEGETGTGKTLLAEALHRASARHHGPFVVLDCSAIPPTLIESELFGHERGAFTGADRARAGVFEAAAAGTLFLDEIGELPLAMQPKLLRALEERLVRRIGSTRDTAVDARIIAASNRDLRRMVNRGDFRDDLFYRLAIVRLRLPPLRERVDDIPLLVQHFYHQFVGDEGAMPPLELVEDLCHHDWPGNVRELRTAVERAVLFDDPRIWREIQEPPHGPPAQWGPDELFRADTPFRVSKERVITRWEARYVSDLIARHDGNLTRAARAARMDRSYLRELVAKHRLAARHED
jgi:DNA-binding NtrC family response regulator